MNVLGLTYFRILFLKGIIIYSHVYEELQLPVESQLLHYHFDPLFSGLGK